MNGNCQTCEIEKECGYPYKPCDCRDYLKFKPKEQPHQSAQVIQLIPKSTHGLTEKGGAA